MLRYEEAVPGLTKYPPVEVVSMPAFSSRGSAFIRVCVCVCVGGGQSEV